MTKFTDAEDEVLIHLVKQNPSIYAIKSKSYKYLNAKNKAWKIVSQAMNKSELDCRTRWKSIRDYYHRKKRAVIEGTATAADGNYFFKKFNHLSFLDSDLFIKKEIQNSPEEQVEDGSVSHPVIEHYVVAPALAVEDAIKSEEIPLLDDVEETNEDQQTANAAEAVSVVVGEFQDDILNDEIEPSELRTKRRNRTESLCSDSKRMKVEPGSSEDSSSDTALDFFFKSVYSTVSDFSPAYQAKAKISIMQAVGSIEIEVAQNDQCKLTPTPSTTATPGTQIYCLQPLMK